MSKSVTFSAGPSRQGALTWGQKWIWNEVVSFRPDHQQLNLAFVVAVPDDCGIERVLEALRILLERYEALRTVFHTVDGEPRQLVLGEGKLQVEVSAAAHGEALSRSAEIVDRMKAVPYGADELPVRAEIVLRDDRPEFLMLGLFHMAVDLRSGQVLLDDTTRLLAGGPPAEAGTPARHPVDEALWEQGPAGVNLSEKSVTYWKEQLQKFPTAMLPQLGSCPENPRFQEVTMTSAALSAALTRLSSRYRATRPTVTLSLIALLLAAWSDNSVCGLTVYSGNRFRGPACAVFGTMVEDVPICIDVSRSALPQIVRRTLPGTLSAYRHGRYDPFRIADAVREVSVARGTPPDLSCAVNVNVTRGAAPEEPHLDRPPVELLSRTRIRKTNGFLKDRDGRRFYLITNDLRDATKVILRGDTIDLPSSDLKLFLESLEALAVCAVEQDVDLVATRRLIAGKSQERP